MLRPGGKVRDGKGGGAWVEFSSLGTMGPPSLLLPCSSDTPMCRLQGGGQPWGELGQQHEAAPGWLWGWLCSRQRAVNSALLKMSNKGEKKRKEKGKWGEHRVGVGEARAERTGGDYLNRRPDSALSFH